jgi:DNA-binding CsgD family transcriptional regulator
VGGHRDGLGDSAWKHSPVQSSDDELDSRSPSSACLYDDVPLRKSGLLAAAGLAIAIVMGLMVLSAFVYSAYDASAGRSAWLGWTLLIVAASCVTNGLVHANHKYGQWEGARWTHFGTVLPRFELGITAREWELLPLLAREDLTYRQIAEELHLSPETIKTHVRHLGEKLGTSGRHKVVSAARQHGLLPDMLEADGPGNSPPDPLQKPQG